MRVSVKKNDTGYVTNPQDYGVLFNGKRRTDCITADEELGMILVYGDYQGGHFVPEVELFGDVKIIKGGK